jgi:hypothetical protein
MEQISASETNISSASQEIALILFLSWARLIQFTLSYQIP